MSADLLPFPQKKFTSEGGGGSGPEDPMLDQRVARLEATLERIEPKITELLLVGAKQTDLHKVQLDIADTKGRFARLEGILSQMPKQSDLAVLRSEIGEIRGRISNMPTWWMLIVAIITTWSAGAAIVFALIRNALK